MDADKVITEALADSDKRDEARKARAAIFFAELEIAPQRDLEELEADVDRQMGHWWSEHG